MALTGIYISEHASTNQTGIYISEHASTNQNIYFRIFQTSFP